jgi:quercetin dioxygenase-like cupin family protein
MDDSMMSKIFFPDAEIALETLEEGRVTRKIRAHDGALMIVEVMFKSGAVGSEHRHVHEQVCYCLAGEFDFTVEGLTTRLRPGDSVYIPPPRCTTRSASVKAGCSTSLRRNARTFSRNKGG